MTRVAVPRWLPNAISVLRILLVPAWVVFAEACQAAVAAAAADAASRYRLLATAVLVVIGASDVVDGWLARRFGLATPLGATIDAAADKLCQVVLVTWLCVRMNLVEVPAFAPLPWWFLTLLVLRDVAILAGYLLVRRRHRRVEVVHRWHGKVSSLLLFGMLVAVTAGVAGRWLQPALLGIAALFAASTFGYARDGLRQLRGSSAAAAGAG